jgi:hypothetical protein
MPPPQPCLSEFAPDPRPVANVPNAPVSNSLGLKKPDGGETADVEDVTGCPPKAAIAREVNITMAKAVSLFIFAFLHVIHAANVALTGQIVVLKGFCKEAGWKLRRRDRLRPNRAYRVALPSDVTPASI